MTGGTHFEPSPTLSHWRRSVDGNLLCLVSLLAGNFTGKITNFGIWEDQRRRLPANSEHFSQNSLSSITGKLIH